MRIKVKNRSLKKYRLTKHLTLIVLLATLFCSLMGSRWTIGALRIPNLYSKRLILFLYSMFTLFIVVMFVRNLCFNRFSVFSTLLYAFAFYSMCILMIRLVLGETVKYTLYWGVIMIGSISITGLVYNNYWRNKFDLKTIINDFITFGLVVVAYKVLFALFLSRLIPYDPLNANKECCIMLILIPCSVLGYLMYGEKKYAIGVLLFSFIILYSGSRGGLLLCVFEVVVICLLWIKHSYKVDKLVALILLFILISVGLLVFNVANIQYYTFRALRGVFYSSSFGISAIDQMSRSDSGRRELFFMAYKEFLKSPLIGTGIVYFNQTIDGLGQFNQSSHNFILETLDCFGILGLVQLTLIFFAFCTIMPKHNRCKSYFIILSCAFLAYAFVEPMLYDPLSFLTYCVSAMICLITSKNHSIKLYKQSIF